MANTLDFAVRIAIVGTGGAAMAAAIRAAEEGAAVTMIERATLGGTCVNVGCIPSKIMIRAAHIARLRTRSAFDIGIGAVRPEIDRAKLFAMQQARVESQRDAKYTALIENNPAIELIRGQARFLGPRRLQVAPVNAGYREIAFDRAFIATGASPVIADVAGLATTPYWTSNEALAAETLPGHLVVYGGSSVALELSQAFLRLGSQVTLIARSTLLSREDPLIGEFLKRVLEDEGMRVLTDRTIEQVAHRDGGFAIEVAGESIAADRLLIATGRRANTDGLGLERAGVRTDAHGAIVVDEHLRTDVQHIYAGGDCAAMPQYVYVAAAAGTRAAVNMLGGDVALDLCVVPAIVFTDPQVACVGLDERSAQRRGQAVETRTLTLDNVPRALANFDTRGFIKLVADAGTRRILGAQILAPEAGEIIQIAALAIRHGMRVDELGDEMFPYLVMAEGLKLCAQTFRKDVTQLSCCAG